MIVIWVTELFMNQMGALRSSNTSYLHDSQYMELQKQFDSFLAIPKVEVHKENTSESEIENIYLLNFAFFYVPLALVKLIWFIISLINFNTNQSFLWMFRNV